MAQEAGWPAKRPGLQEQPTKAMEKQKEDGDRLALEADLS